MSSSSKSHPHPSATSSDSTKFGFTELKKALRELFYMDILNRCQREVAERSIGMHEETEQRKRARQREYVVGSTVWHKGEKREGIVHEDAPGTVLVYWTWPESLKPRWEDKAIICLSHERNEDERKRDLSRHPETSGD